MAGGRPPFYNTVEELQARIDEYWNYIKGEADEGGGWIRQPEYATVTGLALYLGFTTRQALLNYEGKDEFVDAVKKAKTKIESAYEQALFGKNAAGPIFALKNFGWTDKQEIDQKTTIQDERIDESTLTDEELRFLAEIQRKGSSIKKAP